MLEGPDNVVQALFDQIAKDKRHDSIRLLLRKEMEAKEFEEWSMAFINVEALPVNLAGYVPYKHVNEFVGDTARAKDVIRSFQEGKWRHVVTR